MSIQRFHAARIGGLALLLSISGLAQPASAQVLAPEVQVGTRDIVDYEFDWGRDGAFCPDCNFGAGNARFAYIDILNRLWVGSVDFQTGNFVPPNGRGTLVDTNSASATEIGNGPEWMFSARGSEIVYTRWTDGAPKQPSSQNVGFARMVGGKWQATILPDTQFRAIPGGSIDVSESTPHVAYKDSAGTTTSEIYWRDVPSPTEHKLPLDCQPACITRRWVPGTQDLFITAPANTAGGGVYRQAYLYHTRTSVLEQLTFDPVDKTLGLMWRAPEFGNENVFYVLLKRKRLAVYRNLGQPGGAAQWTIVNMIAMPDAAPYITSPEVFVHNGRSWIFFQLSANANPSDYSAPNLLAMVSVDPAAPEFRPLTAWTDPPRLRQDPEYFITANGPYIYYNRFVPSTATSQPVHEGVFRVDTLLGPRLP